MQKKRIFLVLAVIVFSVLLQTGFVSSESILPKAVIGDLNADANVNATDYALIRRYVLGIISEIPATDKLLVADLNGDSLINSMDCAILKRYLLGIIDKFPKVQNEIVTMTLEINGNDDIGGTGGGSISVSPPALDGSTSYRAVYGSNTYKLNYPAGTVVTFTPSVYGAALFSWASNGFYSGYNISLTIKGGELLKASFYAPDPTPRRTPVPTPASN